MSEFLRGIVLRWQTQNGVLPDAEHAERISKMFQRPQADKRAETVQQKHLRQCQKNVMFAVESGWSGASCDGFHEETARTFRDKGYDVKHTFSSPDCAGLMPDEGTEITWGGK